MTDLERFQQLLDTFGIEFVEDKEEEVIRVRLEVGNSKVKGYYGFATEFQFTPSGEFIVVDIYE